MWKSIFVSGRTLLWICTLKLRVTVLHYLCSANLSKSFSQLIVSIFFFSQYFFSIDFTCGKRFSQLILSIFIFSQYFFQWSLILCHILQQQFLRGFFCTTRISHIGNTPGSIFLNIAVIWASNVS